MTHTSPILYVLTSGEPSSLSLCITRVSPPLLSGVEHRPSRSSLLSPWQPLRPLEISAPRGRPRTAGCPPGRAAASSPPPPPSFGHWSSPRPARGVSTRRQIPPESCT